LAGSDGYIYLCYVRPEAKSQGIGLQMLNAAEAWLKSIGCNSIKADSTATALGFYTHHGFISSGKPELIDGMFSYPLKKPVTL
jgi:GNAT superfamily N-acetyltransferase